MVGKRTKSVLLWFLSLKDSPGKRFVSMCLGKQKRICCRSWLTKAWSNVMSPSTERFHKWNHYFRLHCYDFFFFARYCSASSSFCSSEICSINSPQLPWFCLGDTICWSLPFSLAHTCLGGAIQQVVSGTSFSHLNLYGEHPKGVF